MLRTVLFFILSWVFVSCSVTIDVDLPAHKPKLTVNSYVTPDSAWSASIHLNQQVLEDKEYFESVTNAVVSIYLEGAEIITLPHIGHGVYRAPSGIIEVEKPYELRVSVDDFEPLSAQSSVPKVTEIKNLEFSKGDGDENYDHFILTFEDRPGEDNYYEVAVKRRDSYTEDTGSGVNTWTNYSSAYIEFDNPTFNNGDSFYYEGILFNDGVFDGKTMTIDFDVAYFSSGITHPEVTVESSYIVYFRTLSKDYYLHKTTSLLQEATSDNPFAQPVSIYTNVGKGVGIFAGYNQEVAEVDL